MYSGKDPLASTNERICKMSIVTIIGAGMMGSALTFPLRDNGNEVRLVGTPLDTEIIESAKRDGTHPTLKRRLPDGTKYYQFADFQRALDKTDLLLCGVSSFGVDWFSENVLRGLPASIPVLSVTKGMMNGEDGELIPYPELYRRRLGRNDLSLCAIGGPCTSYELADRDQTEVCFCGSDIALLRRIKAMFETDYYHISLSDDEVGVECAVALKNAYALGVTLAVGLSEARDGKLHYNSQAALFGQSIREMRRLLAICGGRDELIYLGAGDLYVTVFGGRTRLIGTLLGKGMSFDAAMEKLSGITLESIVIASRTAAAVRTLAARGKVSLSDFPLLMHIDGLINNGERVNIPWDSFEDEIRL